ncbi:leucine-rich repeat extensin-like protein 2 [Zingiber officinale]|uniref:leucine-rich repeat extensin-like protein 2 n=1 Tax=Zingiber officinale TaxID=94328 RepID=UPI001C4B4B70|nr:leucine-rich repeat extensin-like protein 2 [Zingiber officinale]
MDIGEGKTREKGPPLQPSTPATSNAGNVRRRALLALTHKASCEHDDFPSSPFSSPRHHHTPEDDATTRPTSPPPSASRWSRLREILPLFSLSLLSSRRSCLRAVLLPLAEAASEPSPSPPLAGATLLLPLSPPPSSDGRRRRSLLLFLLLATPAMTASPPPLFPRPTSPPILCPPRDATTAPTCSHSSPSPLLSSAFTSSRRFC